MALAQALPVREGTAEAVAGSVSADVADRRGLAELDSVLLSHTLMVLAAVTVALRAALADPPARLGDTDGDGDTRLLAEGAAD